MSPAPRSAVRPGFTLMELLTVIAIIAILASLLMSGIKLVKRSALRLACTSNVRQLLVAGMTYANDWDGFLPPYSADGSYYYAIGTFYLNGVSNAYLTDRIPYAYSDFTFFKCLWPEYATSPKAFCCPRGAQPSKSWQPGVWGGKTSYIYRYLAKNSAGYYYATTIGQKSSNSVLINEPTRTPWSPHSDENPRLLGGVPQMGASHGYVDGHVAFMDPSTPGWTQSISPFF